jgi:hypothetical protein
MSNYLFIYLFQGNLANKTKIGTAYTCGTINSKPPRPIIEIDQSEMLSYSQVQFTLFLEGAPLVLLLLPATASCTNLVQINQFLELR